MKRYVLVVLALLLVVVTACGPIEPTQAQLVRQVLQKLDAREAFMFYSAVLSFSNGQNLETGFAEWVAQKARQASR
jgi:hypothetical protein